MSTMTNPLGESIPEEGLGSDVTDNGVAKFLAPIYSPHRGVGELVC
jgi:hypothetical protein